MSMDLIIAENGHVMIASNKPFSAPVARVDFDVQARQLMLVYEDDAHEPDVLGLPVHDRLLPALMSAPRVLLVAVHNNEVTDGFDAPLTCVDFN